MQDSGESASAPPARWVLASGLLDKRRDGVVRSGSATRVVVLTPTALFYLKAPKESLDFLGHKRGMMELTDIETVAVVQRKNKTPMLKITLKKGKSMHKYDRITAAVSYARQEINLLAPRKESDPEALLIRWRTAIVNAIKHAHHRSPASNDSWQTNFSSPAIAARKADFRNESATGEGPAAAAKEKKRNRTEIKFGNWMNPNTRRIVLTAALTLSMALLYQNPQTPVWFFIAVWAALVTITCLAVHSYAPRRSARPLLPSAHHSSPIPCRVVREPLKPSVKQPIQTPAATSRPRKRREFLKLPPPGWSIRLAPARAIATAGAAVKSASGASSAAEDTKLKCCYSLATGTSIKLRIGPDYARKKLKAFGLAAMYETAATDFISPKKQCHHIAEQMELEFKSRREAARTPVPSGAAVSADGFRDIPLPRLIIVNYILPQNGPQFFSGTHCDEEETQHIVIYLHITSDTVQDAARGDKASPAVRLLSRFCREASNTVDDKFVRSRFKTVYKVSDDDFAKLGIGFAEGFNGKPVMLRTTTQFYCSSPIVCGCNRYMYDYMEVDIHVTRWDYVKRVMASKMRPTMCKVDVLLGFLIEGVTDDELPERLFGAVQLHRLDPDQAPGFPPGAIAATAAATKTGAASASTIDTSAA